MTEQDPSPLQALASIWDLAGGDPAALAGVALQGEDPVLPSTFRVGTAAASTIAASALAATELWRLRTGETQTISLDLRAAAAAFRSERYLRVDGQQPPGPWGPIAGYYRTADKRWIQLHTNFPHHHQGVIDLLGCADEREAVREAVVGWEGQALEDAIAERGLCAGLLRSPQEWAAHPQAAAVASLPLFEILPLGESEPEPLGPANRPLSGVRVLDLTRVIAGPVCGRTLASHGAEVLRIGAPHLPTLPHVWLDMAQGKRAAFLDLRKSSSQEQLRALLADCDVFVQGYRPGALAGRGFSPQEAARLRPGIVYVTLSAYSHRGPWSDRRGFDSLVQTVSGFGHAGARAAGVDRPSPLPCQALDHASGYLMALGAMMALQRRAQEGGSWLVRVSLAQTGRWIWDLGRIDGLGSPDPNLDDVHDLLLETATEAGPVATVAPPALLSSTPARWEQPPVSLGTHPPAWSD